MIFASGFTWFTLLDGLRDDRLFAFLGVHSQTNLFVSGCLAAGLLLLLAIFARLGLNRAMAREGLERYHGEERLTSRTFFELLTLGALGMMTDLMGKKEAKAYFPLVGTLFLYIFFNNLLALVPGLAPPTDNINTNIGMAIVVFLVFMWVGLTRDPIGFLKHLWGPMLATGVIIFPVELLGLFLRPVSLSLRLTGNMFGDHTAFSVVSHLAPPLVPTFMIGLALFVSFMQAFVFSLLTAVYISMSLPHAEHDDHH
jgi:F-type H+-transporting ATPase subunit a